MSDPYTAASYRDVDPEVRSHRDEVLARFRELGANDEEVAQIAEAWDDLDPSDSTEPDAWTREKRDALRYAGDHELQRLLDRARREYTEGTTTEEEEAEAEHARAVDAARVEALDRIGGTVGAILGWVGDDLARAHAVLSVEPPIDEGGRKTLIEPLEELVTIEPVDDGTGGDGLGKLAALLLAVGVPEDEALEAELTLSEAAGVIGAAYGVDPEAVDEEIRGGLIGEPDGLARYGIVIPPVTVEGVSMLDAVQARFQVIVSAAQGLAAGLPQDPGGDTAEEVPEAAQGDPGPEAGES